MFKIYFTSFLQDALPVVVDGAMQWWMRFMKISYYDRATVMAPATFIKPGTMQAIFDFSKHIDAVSYTSCLDARTFRRYSNRLLVIMNITIKDLIIVITSEDQQ